MYDQPRALADRYRKIASNWVSTFATSALLRTLDTTSVGGVCRNVADILEDEREEQC